MVAVELVYGTADELDSTATNSLGGPGEGLRNAGGTVAGAHA